MKKLTATLLFILTLFILVVSFLLHPPIVKEVNYSIPDSLNCDKINEAGWDNAPQQKILPNGFKKDSDIGHLNRLSLGGYHDFINSVPPRDIIMAAHVFCIAYMLLAAILSLSCLFDKTKKQLHTDEEFRVKSEELIKVQSELDESIKASEEQKASLEKELEKVKADNESLSSKAENLAKDNKGGKREIDKLNSKINAVQNEKDQMTAQVAELKKELEEQKEEINAAKANVKGGKEAIPPAAYQILYLLQKEGRLIDILSEDVSEVDDEALGGAVRPVLEGCAKLLKERLIVEPVLKDKEGSIVTLDEADPESVKLSGSVPAKGPYKGELIHHGWRLRECNLPELVDGWKGNVIAPAEIEIA